MDTTLVDVYKQMVRLHRCTVDDILVDPKLRQEFLSNSRSRLGTDVEEVTLLRRLHNLRKRSKLPRTTDLIAAQRPEARP